MPIQGRNLIYLPLKNGGNYGMPTQGRNLIYLPFKNGGNYGN